jgi:hypothetical protein
VALAFVLGSLILGTLEGHPFKDNLSFGAITGLPAGLVVGLVLWALVRRSAHRPE